MGEIVNYARDPSFEHDVLGSSPSSLVGTAYAKGATSLVVAGGLRSAQSCRLTTPGSAANEGLGYEGDPARPGTSYRFDLWVKGAKGGELLEVGIVALGNGELTTVAFVAKLDWERVGVAHTMSMGASGAAVAFVRTQATHAYVCAIDSARFSLGSTASQPYTDGDVKGYAWSGTIGDSFTEAIFVKPKNAPARPHFGFPYQRGVTVEQDTTEHIMACEQRIVACPLGFRQERPEFGWPWPLFQNAPIDTDALTSALRRFEPRSEATGREYADEAEAAVRHIEALIPTRS